MEVMKAFYFSVHVPVVYSLVCPFTSWGDIEFDEVEITLNINKILLFPLFLRGEVFSFLALYHPAITYHHDAVRQRNDAYVAPLGYL